VLKLCKNFLGNKLKCDLGVARLSIHIEMVAGLLEQRRMLARCLAGVLRLRRCAARRCYRTI